MAEAFQQPGLSADRRNEKGRPRYARTGLRCDDGGSRSGVAALRALAGRGQADLVGVGADRIAVGGVGRVAALGGQRASPGRRLLGADLGGVVGEEVDIDEAVVAAAIGAARLRSSAAPRPAARSSSASAIGSILVDVDDLRLAVAGREGEHGRARSGGEEMGLLHGGPPSRAQHGSSSGTSCQIATSSASPSTKPPGFDQTRPEVDGGLSRRSAHLATSPVRPRVPVSA